MNNKGDINMLMDMDIEQTNGFKWPSTEYMEMYRDMLKSLNTLRKEWLLDTESDND